MEDFGEVNIVEKVQKLYNRFGNEEVQSYQKAFASYEKTVFVNDVSRVVYKVLFLNNSLYDPLGPDSHRESSLELKLQSVNRETFENYLKYLRKKNSLYLTKANRSFINAQN